MATADVSETAVPVTRLHDVITEDSKTGDQVCMLKCVLVWDITQRRVVFPYRRFGTNYGSRNVGKELSLYAA